MLIPQSRLKYEPETGFPRTCSKTNMSLNSSTSSSLSPLFLCLKSSTGIFIFTFFVITYVLFLPVFLVVICLGLQHRRQQSSRMSHSDFFTFNVVGLELMCVLGFCVLLSAIYSDDQSLQLVGLFLCSIATSGQVLFHLLTCVERYLAAVHPVTYLGLKQAGGLRIRNGSAVCVWLLCGLIVMIFNGSYGEICNFCFLVVSLIVVSFCSVSVICAVTRSGPGPVARTQVDRSKLRAFHTIAAITVAQYLQLVGNLVTNIVFNSPVLTVARCAVGTSALWLTLPCSLVLPLLFLQRAGKLAGCKRITKSG